MDADVLLGLADATGGVFFHGDNDFREGHSSARAPSLRPITC
jgi:hypothetical protein